jgi:hypothetical protein
MQTISLQIPCNSSLHPESFFAIDIATQGELDSNTLEVIGWLYERVEVGLLSHGDGDGRGFRKDELGDNVGGDKTGGVLIQFIAQGSLK